MDVHARIDSPSLAQKFDAFAHSRRVHGLLRGLGIPLLCLVVLTGCPASSHFVVEEINYKGTTAPAAILIGDPQVYARASLINDRRQETEYLQQLLANSAVKADGSTNVHFSPQIVRDLKTVDALSASLGVNVGRGASNSDISSQVDAAMALPSSTSPDLAKAQSQIKDLQTQLQALSTSGSVGPTPPTNGYGALLDPRDDLIDRQGYRRDVRAALAEAQLDDTHDWAGHALYRLQFQATVLPPDGHSQQWGVAKLSIKPPEMTWDEIVQMYYSWLNHITSFLNNASSGAEHDYNYDRFVVQIGAAKLFKVIDVYVDSEQEPADRYCWVHGSATDQQLRDIDAGLSTGFWGRPHVPDGKDKNGKPKEKAERWMPKVGSYAVPPTFNKGDPTSACSSYTDWTVNDQQPKKGPIAPDLWSFIQTQIPGVTSRSDSRRPTTSLAPAPDDYSGLVPFDFCKALVDDNSKCGDVAAGFLPPLDTKFKARGGDAKGGDYAIKSYSVLPAQLAQRIGVTTEASQSLQTAISIAGQLSAAASAGVDAGYLSQADVRMQAIARQPLVVGFAGTARTPDKVATTRGATATSTLGEGFFGWLFGPSLAVKNSKTMSMQHDVTTYGVNSDVSIPGWWAYFQIDIKTAWISNWQSANLIDDELKTAKSTKRVNVPRFDAAFDALTDFMANEQHKATNGRIFVTSVTPNVLPACASLVTLQISGSNIWRANSALLSGVPAKQISVLPDMNGITAQFDMSEIFGTLGSTQLGLQVMPLSIAAEQGIAPPRKIYVVGKRQVAGGVTTCQSPLLTPTNFENIPATVVSSSPQSVCTDTQSFPLVLQGIKLSSGLGAKSGVFKAADVSLGDDNTQMLMLTRASPSAKLTARTETIAVGPDAGPYTFVTVDIKDCSAAKKEDDKTAEATTKATLVTTTVKLAKDQEVELKVDIPESYSSLVVSVRPHADKPAPTALAGSTSTSPKGAKPKAAEPVWTKSAPITNAKAGKTSDVVGLLDLTNVAAKAGDKLDVQVEITPRPAVKAQPIAADHTLTVAAP